MAIGFIHFRKNHKTLRYRISDFFEEHFVLQATLVMIIFYAIVLGTPYAVSKDDVDISTKESIAGRKLFRHVVEIERANGIKDTIIYHDFYAEPDIDAPYGTHEPFIKINASGENWRGVKCANIMEIENVKYYKILE